MRVYTLVLRVVVEASQRIADRGLSPDDVVGVLASSLAAHQNRLAGKGNAFEPARIATVLAELQREQFVADDGSGLRLSHLGEVVASSGLAVRSATRVARVFRLLQPHQLNRATIITTAQLTTELEDTRLNVNVMGVNQEILTFTGLLNRQATASQAMAALRTGTPAVVAARAKKAAACLLWMNGVPSGQLERMVMQHYRDRNAIGPIRAVASRTQDIIGAVLDMAAVIHPTADLARLVNLLPVQLELGIPADLAPIALAGAGLTRENYLYLMGAGLSRPAQISAADDETVLKCLGNSRQRLQALRDAVRQAAEADSIPALDEALPPPTD